MFHLPSNEVFLNIIRYLSENKLEYQQFLLGEIIRNLELEYAYEQHDIKDGVLSLIAAGCFMREPEDGKLSEQKLSFIYHSAEQTLNALKEAMYAKLEKLIKNVRDEVFHQLFG